MRSWMATTAQSTIRGHSPIRGRSSSDAKPSQVGPESTSIAHASASDTTPALSGARKIAGRFPAAAGGPLIVTGGTGLYVKALVEGR